AYSLEYGLDEMEMHQDAVHPGERIILVDDLIATGGTAEAAVRLLRTPGAPARPGRRSTARAPQHGGRARPCRSGGSFCDVNNCWKLCSGNFRHNSHAAAAPALEPSASPTLNL